VHDGPGLGSSAVLRAADPIARPPAIASESFGAPGGDRQPEDLCEIRAGQEASLPPGEPPAAPQLSALHRGAAEAAGRNRATDAHLRKGQAAGHPVPGLRQPEA